MPELPTGTVTFDVESGDPVYIANIQAEALAIARPNLDESEFAEAWAEGNRLTIADTVNEALGRSEATATQ